MVMVIVCLYRVWSFPSLLPFLSPPFTIPILPILLLILLLFIILVPGSSLILELPMVHLTALLIALLPPVASSLQLRLLTDVSAVTKMKITTTMRDIGDGFCF